MTRALLPIQDHGLPRGLEAELVATCARLIKYLRNRWSSNPREDLQIVRGSAGSDDSAASA